MHDSEIEPSFALKNVQVSRLVQRQQQVDLQVPLQKKQKSLTGVHKLCNPKRDGVQVYVQYMESCSQKVLRNVIC